jgi:hypothetical protein
VFISKDIQTTLNRPTCVLTPKGQAVTAVYKLLAALRCLDADERADCLELLEMELGELPPVN